MSGIRIRGAELRLKLGSSEARGTERGEMTVQFERWKKGADPSALFKGLPDDMCQSHHYGYLISGRMAHRTKDGEQIVEAGEAYYIGPGHIPIALEDCELVEFTPTQELLRTIKHVR